MPTNALTATFVLNKSRKDRLEAVRELNAWGQELEDLSILAQTPALEVLALACNNVRSLKQISRCKKLRQLLLRRNQVSDIAEIYNLSRLPDLQVLSLTENPIASEPDYRQKILACLPKLQKLDDILVTPDEVEEAQARFPDALHGVSADGGPSGPNSRPVSDTGAAGWDGQQPQTTPGPSPGRSPAVTPPGAVPQQAQTPPRSRTPPPANGSAPQPDGGGTGFRDPSYYSGPPRQYGGTYGASTPQQQLPSPHMQQQAPTPPQQPRENVGNYGSGNGVPSPVPQQQYYSPPPQMQPDYGPNNMPQFQGVPQYATTGWASPPQQQQPPPVPQPAPTQTSPSESTSDNIFYAIVALLPELSPKHLVWVKGEVEARMLEIKQQQLDLNA